MSPLCLQQPPLSGPEVTQENLPSLPSRSKTGEPPLSGPEISQKNLSSHSPGSQRGESACSLLQENLHSVVQKSVRRTLTRWSRIQTGEPPLSLIQKLVSRTSILCSKDNQENLPLSSRSQSGEPLLSHPEVSQENLPSVSFKNLHSLVQKSVRKTSHLSRPKVSLENLPSLIQKSVRRISPLSHPDCGQQNLPSLVQKSIWRTSPLLSRSQSGEPPVSLNQELPLSG